MEEIKQRLLNIFSSPVEKFQRFCYVIGLSVVVCVLIFMLTLVMFFSSLPDIGEMKFSQVRTIGQKRVHQRLEDKKIKHKWVDIDKINRNCLWAIVTSEDSSFFEHNGINYDAIVNSAVMNLKKKKYEYGASTISQQVVKNLFLEGEKKLSRKFKEIIITDRMERYFTKNEILEVYLNVAEFGPDIFGIEAAAKHYFKKTPQQLNAAEGAFLAIMLPSPRKLHFSIFENKNLPETKKKKIRRIMGDMLAQEYISPQQYKEYIRYNYFKYRTPASKR